MEKIYEVSGTLNKGFVGQISYSVCLEKDYNEMDIRFSFDKQYYPEVTEELKREITDICRDEYPGETATDETITNAIRGMKTEIHTIVTMNDQFIGGIHKQLTDRHMHFSPAFTSDGCIMQQKINGVIRITLVVFNVLMDHTQYSLTLSAL
jgi:hypothetical protein